MLYYDRIDLIEGIGVSKTSAQKSAIFVTIGIFQIKGLSFNHMSTMNVYKHISMRMSFFREQF